MTRAALQLWTGQTVHARFSPFENRFAYKIVLIDIDIDRLDEAGRLSALFNVNRPGLFAFNSRDHGDGDGTPLRPWAVAQFAKAGVDIGRGAIRLVTFPRHLFYKFAPLSLWYGYDEGGMLRSVVYEVRNTFGEKHCYVAAAGDGRTQHDAEKNFHVSPFFDVTGRYRFTLHAPSDKLDVMVESVSPEGARLHMANIKAKARTANNRAFLLLALRNPLSTLGVTIGIHWEALKLWRRGAVYRPKPAPPLTPTTRAEPLPTSLLSKDPI